MANKVVMYGKKITVKLNNETREMTIVIKEPIVAKVSYNVRSQDLGKQVGVIEIRSDMFEADFNDLKQNFLNAGMKQID